MTVFNRHDFIRAFITRPNLLAEILTSIVSRLEHSTDLAFLHVFTASISELERRRSGKFEMDFNFAALVDVGDECLASTYHDTRVGMDGFPDFFA